MAYDVVIAPAAAEQIRGLEAYERAEVKDGLERYLRNEPTKTSRSRIKRLRDMDVPQYRLRLGELRVFYVVTSTQVDVLAVVAKSESQAWLDAEGTPSAPR